MHPEQGLLKGVEQLAVGFLVFVLGAVLGRFEPEGMHVVQGLFRLGLFFLLGAGGLAVLPGGLIFAQVLQINGHAHVPAVALQHLPDAVTVQEFLFVLHDVQNHGGAALRAPAVPHGEGHAVLAFPDDGGGALLIGQGVDGHFVGGHEGGIEAQAEMADDAALVVAGVVFEELLGAGEGHLIDVFFHFPGGHADAVVREAQFARRLVHRDGDPQVLVRFALEHFVLGDGVAAVAHHFTDENVLVGIQPALDHRHDVLGMDGNAALGFHGMSASCFRVVFRGAPAPLVVL